MKNTKIKTTKDTENITNISAAIKNAVDYLIANPKDFPGLAASGKLYDDALVANTTLQNLNGGANVSIGNLSITKVDIRCLYLDTAYQTHLRRHADAKLVNDWDLRKVGTITLSYRNNKLYVIDGGHRISAALKHELFWLPAVIYTDLTQAEEAEIFAYQNKNVASLKPIDKYTSLLVAGDTITTNIERITEQYGFVVTNKKKNVPRAISSFGALYTIMTDDTTIGYDGCACLEWILQTMLDSLWCEHPDFACDTWMKGFMQVYKEGLTNHQLANYKDNLVAILSHITPSYLSSFASTDNPSAEKRGKASAAILKIARGRVTLKEIFDIVEKNNIN